MYQSNLSIKAWAEEDRPREKLLLKGKSVLSDAELIAILLGSGFKDTSAVELAKQLLQKAENNLNALGKFAPQELMEFKGIGEAKAVTIAAALELGRRRQQTNALERKIVTCSQDIYEIIGPEIADLSHEEFWIVMLNRRNAVLSHQLVSKGGMTGTVVDPKVLFGIALREKATALAIAHNHPSGQLKPSQGDIQITKQIKEAGKVLNIDIIDHIIVTDQGYYSFADTNNM